MHRPRGPPSRLEIGGFGAAVGDVGADGPGEQERLLGHEPELVAVGRQVQVANRGAVDGHRAGGGVVEAGDQLHQGGLARTGRTDQRDDLSGRDGQADVVHRDQAGGLVGEGDVVQADLPAQPRRSNRMPGLRGGRRRLQQLTQLGRGDLGLHPLVEHRRELPHGREELVQVEQERNQHTVARGRRCGTGWPPQPVLLPWPGR